MASPWWARYRPGCRCRIWPAVSAQDVQSLLLAGIGVAVVAYGDNTLIARAFPVTLDDGEDKNLAVVDPQQELIALGGVHLVVGLTGGFPVSSSGSRTALAIAGNARTQLYSLVSALCVVIVLFVAAPLISDLPQASLGAVVFYAASKLVLEGVRPAGPVPAERTAAGPGGDPRHRAVRDPGRGRRRDRPEPAGDGATPRPAARGGAGAGTRSARHA